VSQLFVSPQAVPKRQRDSIPLTNLEKQNMTSLALTYINLYWLVVSTPLKNISQIGNLPQIGMKIKNI